MQRKQAKIIIDLVVKQLSEERKKQGISHERLAAMCEMHRSAISLIEARKREPTLLTLLKIASALKYDLGKLITKSVNKS